VTLTPRWQRLFASLGLITALTLPSGAALAAPSSHITEHRIDIGGGTRNDDAIVFLALSVSDLDGAGADIQVWLPPDVDHLHPPTLVSGRADLSAAADDSSVTGSVDLFFNDGGRFAGSAIIDASLSPFGAPVFVEDRSDGNEKVRRDETYQLMDVTGTITVPGRSGVVSLPLEDLFATVGDRALFQNDPSSMVIGQNFTAMELWWEVDGTMIGIKGESDKAISWVESAVILPDGSILNGSDEDATVDHRRIAADVQISPVGQGLVPTGGTVEIRADVSRGESESFVTRDGDDRLQITVQNLIARGTATVTLDDGTSWTLDFAEATGAFVSVGVKHIDGGREG
jgi:hypothetical protein